MWIYGIMLLRRYDFRIYINTFFLVCWLLGELNCSPPVVRIGLQGIVMCWINSMVGKHTWLNWVTDLPEIDAMFSYCIDQRWHTVASYWMNALIRYIRITIKILSRNKNNFYSILEGHRIKSIYFISFNIKLHDVFILNTGKIYPIITPDSQWCTCSSDNFFAISWKWGEMLH